MPIPIIVAAEDALLENIARRLLNECGDKYHLQKTPAITGGHGKIDINAPKWNQSAVFGNVHFVLRDLDTLAFPENRTHCPENKISTLLGNQEKHERFLFRMAVAEGENWLIADFGNLSKFLGCRAKKQPSPDEILNGKEFILDMIKKSSKREIKEGMLPRGTAKTGPLWNYLMSDFIHKHWQPLKAAKNSKSLRRTLNRLKEFSLPT